MNVEKTLQVNYVMQEQVGYKNSFYYLPSKVRQSKLQQLNTYNKNSLEVTADIIITEGHVHHAHL